MSDITVKQGDTFFHTLTVTNSDGTPANLTGAMVNMYLSYTGATPPLTTFPLVILDAEAGTATLTISAADTAALVAGRTYRYEVEVIDTLSQVLTPVEGRLFVLQDRG